MSAKEDLSNVLNSIVSRLYSLEKEVKIENPQDESHGDYATNIALTLTKELKKNPREIAKEIVSELEKQDLEFISKIEIAGPGFINFYLSEEFLVENIKDLNSNAEKYLSSDQYKGKKVVVEYTDPNPFKIFHIGHLYSNAVGESISRLYEANAAEVHRANFYGDVGMHVAKAIWGILEKLKAENSGFEDLKEYTLSDRIKFMGEAYALGATKFKLGTKEQREEIKQINSIIYVVAQELWEEEGIEPVVDYKKFMKQGDFDKEEIKKIYKTGRKWSLEYFEKIYEILDTNFDGYYPESRSGEIGYELVQEGLEKGIFEKSDGAVVFPGDKFGLHTRVFINSLGLPTYETKDFGLAPWKYENFKYDKSIIVTANEIDSYFKVVIRAMKELQPEFGEKTFHISHGIVKLPDGKMSSRTGKIISGEWLISEAKTKAEEKIRESKKDVLKEDEIPQVAQNIALAGIKYSLLKSTIGKDTAFDFDRSISFEGNSGPYIQYTYARCRSVLKGKELNNDTKFELNDEELDILRYIVKYQETIESAARDFSPNILANYIYELAQKFNTFYNKHKIIGEEKYQSQRLEIVNGVSKILKTGLNLLGIPTNEKM